MWKKYLKLTRYITSKPVIYIEVFTVKGKISKYLSFRGYGFISVEGQEKDIFFHMSKYPQREIPVQDQLIEFDIEENDKGKEAVNIKIIREESEAEVPEEAEPIVEVEKEEAPVVEAKIEPEEAPIAVVNDLDKLNGVGPKYRSLLESANVQTCKEVSGYAPEVLLANLLAINEKEQVTKRPPNLTKVKEWIALAAKVVE